MILLSFDTEEFDVPRESGVDFPLEEAMKVSRYGTTHILDILKARGVRATFFCTTNFAENAPDIMARIVAEGHEVAAHGCDHWHPEPQDVFRSRQRLRELTGQEVAGYRQPRMFPVSDEDIRKAGYKYNSSLNPCWIPGHYNHLRDPYGRREVFSTGNTYVLVDCCNDRDALEHIHKKLDKDMEAVDQASCKIDNRLQVLQRFSRYRRKRR